VNFHNVALPHQNLLVLTFPPPIWGTRAVGMSTVVPSMTRKCWNPRSMASAASKCPQISHQISWKKKNQSKSIL